MWSTALTYTFPWHSTVYKALSNISVWLIFRIFPWDWKGKWCYSCFTVKENRFMKGKWCIQGTWLVSRGALIWIQVIWFKSQHIYQIFRIFWGSFPNKWIFSPRNLSLTDPKTLFQFWIAIYCLFVFFTFQYFNGNCIIYRLIWGK